MRNPTLALAALLAVPAVAETPARAHALREQAILALDREVSASTGIAARP